MSSLNRSEILKLYLLKKSKGIKNKDISLKLGVSESAVSQFFSFKKSMSDVRISEMVDYINSVPAESDFN